MKSVRMTMRWGGLLLGGLLLWLTWGTSTAHAQSVDIGFTGIPVDGQVLVGQRFTVTVEARADAQEVDTAVAFLTFDPSILQVVTVTVGSDLDFALEDIGESFYTLDNGAGTLSYQAGILGGSVSGTFTLFAVEFAAANAGQSELAFVNDAANDRNTAVLRAGVHLLRTTESAQISAVLDIGPGGESNEVYLPLIARESEELDPNAVRAGMAEAMPESTPADEAAHDETQLDETQLDETQIEKTQIEETGIATDATGRTDTREAAREDAHSDTDDSILSLSASDDRAESATDFAVEDPFSDTVPSDAEADFTPNSRKAGAEPHAVFLPMAAKQ
jgi:hypothetical protein